LISHIHPPDSGVGSSSLDSSGAELLTGADENRGGAGVAGSVDREGPQGVVDIPQPSQSTDSVNSSSDVVSIVVNDPIPNLDISSPVLSNSSSVDKLKAAIAIDDTLHSCRELAARSENGYSYDRNGVLIHTVLIENVPVIRVVVPMSYRHKILTLAHDKTSHTGVRGMRHLLGRHFTWPGIHSSIVNFVKSCEVCLKVNAAGNKKSHMIERRIVSVPFESVAVDLVGPLPKARRGVKYLFTYVCLATRWPEAVPMRTAAAAEAVQCFTDIISRTGIPLRVLSDRGTIFLSKLMSGLCEMLGIDQVASSPYRPQSNGVVERLHGTLKPMLAKAIESDIDWADFLPLALFAIRQIPNRDLGVSPHCLVYGKNVVGPLDILYNGWVNKEWLVTLNDRLAILNDLVVANQSKASEKRKEVFDRNKTDKVLEVGTQVLMRIPGMKAALQAAWEGPYTILNRSSRVSYQISKGEGHPTRLAHRDNLKVYTPRPLAVNAITLVAEEQGIAPDLLASKASLSDEVCPGYRADDLSNALSSVSEHFSDTPGLCRTGTCRICLVGGAFPVNLPPRQIPGGIRQAVKDEIDKLLAQGIIVKSESAWASPLVPVRKRDGSVRICVDFRQLNALTPLRRYWLPSLTEILEQVGPSMCLSTLDLTAGFHQLEMEPESSELTTFVCPFGRFRYVRMPLGLKNAPAIFQAVVESVLKPVSAFSKNYVDDVVIYSSTWQEHLDHLKRVISCLGKAGLTIKRKKCAFGRKHLLYLGHRIGGGTLAVPQMRTQALANFAKPKTKKQLRSFLGSASYYRSFIPGFADCSSLLTPATSLKSQLQVAWTDAMTEAFCKLKQLLCDSCVLVIPTPDDTFILYTDASGSGVGGCLHVYRDGKELPAGFFSRQLRGAEKNYSVTELESHAIISALKHFEYFVYTKQVKVVTDHKPCLALMDGSTLNKRLLRFALLLQQFSISLEYRPGKSHENADAMSRQSWEADTDIQTEAASGLSALPSGRSLAGGVVGGIMKGE